jgi:hypothetical protein
MKIIVYASFLLCIGLFCSDRLNHSEPVSTEKYLSAWAKYRREQIASFLVQNRNLLASLYNDIDSQLVAKIDDPKSIFFDSLHLALALIDTGLRLRDIRYQHPMPYEAYQYVSVGLNKPELKLKTHENIKSNLNCISDKTMPNYGNYYYRFPAMMVPVSDLNLKFDNGERIKNIGIGYVIVYYSDSLNTGFLQQDILEYRLTSPKEWTVTIEIEGFLYGDKGPPIGM